MIPKTLHLYWGTNKKLSFLRYLTVYSFSKLNPNWFIQVWCPEEPCADETWTTGEQKGCNWEGEDYMLKLSSIPRLTTTAFDFSVLGVSNDLPEVIKSDVFRLYILGRMGGVWSDFDILYTKPMDYYLDILEKQEDAYVCYDDDKKYFSIGFLMGKRGNEFYQGLFKWALAKLNSSPVIDYQMVGSKLFKEYVVGRRSIDKLGFISAKLVYPYKYNEGDFLFHMDMSGDCNVLRRSKHLPGIGIHWFGGSVECASVDNYMWEDNIDEFGHCMIGRIAKEVYSENCVHGNT